MPCSLKEALHSTKLHLQLGYAFQKLQRLSAQLHAGMDELDVIAACLADLREALDIGAAAAADILLSYYAELQHAPHEALHALVEQFRGFLRLLPRDRWGFELQGTEELHQALAGLLPAQHPLRSQLHSVWLELLPALLHGSEAADAGHAKHLELLDHAHSLLPLILDSIASVSNLWQVVSAPVDDKQRSSVLLGALYCQLFAESARTQLGAEQLVAALVPPHFGADMELTQNTIQEAFAAVATVLQSEVVARRLGSLGEEHQRQALARALQCLQQYRTSQPEVVDLWWAVYGAAVQQVVAIAQQLGVATLQQAPLGLLVRALCCEGTAEMLALYLLVHPAHAEPKDGPRKAFGLLAALMQHDTPALLTSCCAALRPENNWSLAVRIEALQAMNKACDIYLGATARDREAPLALWSPSSLETLLLALNKDPSIRIRREAMRLLTSVAARIGSLEEQRLLHTVTLRCRDKDEALRSQAFQMLVQFTPSTLHMNLTEFDWCTLLDLALTAEARGPAVAMAAAGTKAPKAGAGSKHGSAIREAGQALLGLYLFPAGGRGSEIGDGDTLVGPEGQMEREPEGGSCAENAWLDRLGVLLRHCMEQGDILGNDVRLETAYAAALQELVSPGMLCRAAGI